MTMLSRILILNLMIFPQIVSADVVSVAVASNALDAIKIIGNDFQKKYGHSLRISAGSTGKLYAQIYNGAPFDVFLAANAREPERLEKQGITVAGSRFTYALGQLSLCRQNSIKADTLEAILKDPAVKRVSIANPRTAPYGMAARQVLESTGLWQGIGNRLVRGENISQAYQYYVSGNTQAAFLASAQIKAKTPQGSCLTVDKNLYAPIRQQAVMMKRAKNNVAVKLFMDFLKSRHVKHMLTTRFGYGVE